jgi:hypothetical protein
MTQEERQALALRLAKAQTPTPPAEKLREDILFSIKHGPMGTWLNDHLYKRAEEFLTLGMVEEVFDAVTAFSADIMAKELDDADLTAAVTFYESVHGQKIVKTRMDHAEEFRRTNNAKMNELFNRVIEHMQSAASIIIPDGTDNDGKIELIVP